MLSILKVCSFVSYPFCEELAVQLGRDALSESMVLRTWKMYTDALEGRVLSAEGWVEGSQGCDGVGQYPCTGQWEQGTLV